MLVTEEPATLTENKLSCGRKIFLIASPLSLLFLLGGYFFCGAELAAWVDKLSPGCFFARATGLKCPGCGGTRALKALLEGDILRCLQFNAFWIPTIILLLWEYLKTLLQWRKISFSPLLESFNIYLLVTYAGLTVFWAIARNIFGW